MQTTTTNPQETHAFAEQLAREVKPGVVFGLVGTLGTGKTEFVRGFVAALSRNASVCSPSFTLVNTYETPAYSIHHFDFYRLKSSDELFEIGYYEYVADENAVVFIEWADMFPEVLPPGIRYIRFSEDAQRNRIIAIG